MDIKHVLSRNPLQPAYDAVRMPAPHRPPATDLDEHAAGTYEIGHRGQGFCFDNELPRHRPTSVASPSADQAVTCGEWLAFIDDGGYHRPELWLSDGWATVQAEGGSARSTGRGRGRAGRSSPWAGPHRSTRPSRSAT